MKSELLSVCLLSGLWAAMLGCVSLEQEDGVVSVQEVKSLVAQMADLGQAMGRFYRVYGVARFREEELRLVAEMVAIQERCLPLYPDSLEDDDVTWREERMHLYRYYAVRSLRLLKELQAAVKESDMKEVDRLLLEIDSNRRKAHAEFG